MNRYFTYNGITVTPRYCTNKIEKCSLEHKKNKGKNNGIKIPGLQSRIRIESFFFEQRPMNNGKAKELNETKVEQKMNGKVEQRTK
jgi:hypothetical protein